MIDNPGPSDATGELPDDAAAEQRPEAAEAATESGNKAQPLPREDLERELVELNDQRLRAVAELENVRRRAARDIENAHRYGTERFARELLTVADSMEMGLQSLPPEQASTPLAEGMQATQKQLEQCLGKFGISAIEPLGEAFDPEQHEAIATQPTVEQPPGTVIMMVQKGYRIHDRLLRPARVIVSRELDG